MILLPPNGCTALAPTDGKKSHPILCVCVNLPVSCMFGLSIVLGGELPTNPKLLIISLGFSVGSVHLIHYSARATTCNNLLTIRGMMSRQVGICFDLRSSAISHPIPMWILFCVRQETRFKHWLLHFGSVNFGGSGYDFCDSTASIHQISYLCWCQVNHHPISPCPSIPVQF